MPNDRLNFNEHDGTNDDDYRNHSPGQHKRDHGHDHNYKQNVNCPFNKE